MRTPTLLVAAAVVLSAPLAACASGSPELYGASGYSNSAMGAEPASARMDDGLLPEPPADARAGQCFAKVVVPGQPVYGPPSGPHLKWVQSPPPPGAIGPVWCQVWEQGYQPTVTYTPERYGWIRVICDKDATRDKIGRIQRRLHDWGYYQGGYGGEYDAATAEAVRRFQDEHHIEHGGYLSFKTMEALDAPPAVAQARPAPQSFAPPAYPQPVYQAPIYQAPVYAPCQAGCAQPVYQPPCGPAPCQGGYGYPTGAQAYGDQRWLTWPGKAGY